MPAERDSDLEERKFALDSEVRLREITLKEAETKRSGLTAAQATIAGAVLALVSGLAGALITAWSTQHIESGKSLTSLQIEELRAKGNLELEKSKQVATEVLERKKFETALILDAIKTPSRADAIRNLKFFVAAGFVSDPEEKIAKLSDESLPSISAPSPESAGRALRATGRLVTETNQGSTFTCTAVAISPEHVLTASFCINAANKAGQKYNFQLGGRTYPLRVIAQQEQSQLALLQIDSTGRLDTFLDRTRIRDPLVGEHVYFAVALADQNSITLRNCLITNSSTAENDFEHNCLTGPGSAGAVIIAVADDALLGIHHSARHSASGEVGIAAKLSRTLPTLRAYLPPVDLTRSR